jgi:hypothetical protein
VPLEVDLPVVQCGPVGPDQYLDTVTTLQAPAIILSGQDLVLSATVLASGQPVNGGQISFRLDGNEVALIAVDATGSASFSIPAVAVGAHQVEASYARVDPYETSVSATIPVEVSVPTEDLGVSVSTSTLPIRRGSMSTPVIVSAASLNGLSGTAHFQCIGLPAGMTCSFAPTTATRRTSNASGCLRE